LINHIDKCGERTELLGKKYLTRTTQIFRLFHPQNIHLQFPMVHQNLFIKQYDWLIFVWTPETTMNDKRTRRFFYFLRKPYI
jgi:hypothetical protein